MAKLTLPITKSGRQYGYVIWPSNMKERVRDFLKEALHIHLFFQGIDLGEKKVDWRFGRISIGYRWTHRLDENISQYVLTFSEKEDNKLVVECE